MNKKILVPKILGEYTHIYKPSGDVFPGPDSLELKTNQYYSDWVPNDHSFIKGKDGRWHCFGITHPKTSDYAIHDGEWLLFHAVSDEGELFATLKENSWKDEKKVLPPIERPNESNAIHSPYILKLDDKFVMVYAPAPFRYAESDDLYNWCPLGELFKNTDSKIDNSQVINNQTPQELEYIVSTGMTGRDPMILLYNNIYYMVFCSSQNTVELTTSKDFKNWTKPVTIFKCKETEHPESPILIYREGYFYLFWCLWDKTQGSPYSDKTYVFVSQDPFNFNGLSPITELEAHAPEIFQDEYENWYISSAERPKRGISIAKLVWE